MSVIIWAAAGAAVLLVAVVRLLRQSSLKDIRGPPSPSIIYGNEMQVLYQEQVGDLEFQWLREFGTAWKTRGCYGTDHLWMVDPKGLQYIFHTSGYRFPKRADALENIELITGRGLVWAAGDVHQRQRKIMNPAFSTAQLRVFLPMFRRSAARLTQRWKDEIQNASQSRITMNISKPIARMTLDVIGEVAFDYHLGALDDAETELVQVFDNLFADSLFHPTGWTVLFKALWRYIPLSILQYVRYLPTREYKRFRRWLIVADRVGKELVEQKAAGTQKGSKDIMSILVQSNLAENGRGRLSNDEMYAQISTLLLAGHDTTANSLAWILYELSRHPEDQNRIREEIRKTRQLITARGDDDFSSTDLDSMPFTNAVIKESFLYLETLRLHPIVPALVREAESDDIIPLAHPIQTRSGKVISEIHVRKGQSIIASLATYNRVPSVWGNDANEWNPNRFLDMEKERQASVGVIANLMTFSAGIRGCIGWRFAVIEMQAVLTELIENFEFKWPEGTEIIRCNAGLMLPMVRDKMHEGVSMPMELAIAQ